MHIHYFHSGNVQVPTANAVQTMRVCESFARIGAGVELFYPRYLWGNAIADGDCHAYYGVDRTFPLRALKAPFTAGIMTTPGLLPAAKLLAYAREARHPCDVIYTRCATAAAAMPLLRRMAPSPRPIVVFEAHEFPRDRARARTLRRTDAIVAITRTIATELQEALDYPAERILVAPDGVPDAWLAPIAQADARGRLGIDARGPLAVYTGRLHPDMVPLLFAAAEALGGRAVVMAVGAPPGAGRAQARAIEGFRTHARERNLAIEFTGPVPVDQARLYQCAADVLIAPYTGALRWARYTSPLKIFEYMAAGRPMVVSDLPVLHEVLEHEAGAFFVPAADGAAIGRGVATLLDRPDLARRLAERARADAPQYTWNARASRVLQFLARVETAR